MNEPMKDLILGECLYSDTQKALGRLLAALVDLLAERITPDQYEISVKRFEADMMAVARVARVILSRKFSTALASGETEKTQRETNEKP